MADVVADANVYNILSTSVQRSGTYMVSPTVGYIIILDALLELQFLKTTNGGQSWNAGVTIKTAAVYQFDSFPDWQVDGDAGTVIHILGYHKNTESVRYFSLDVSDDSVGGDVLVEACQGTGVAEGVGRTKQFMTISKSVGGKLFAKYWYNDSDVTHFEGFQYSANGGANWTPLTSDFEGSEDHALLVPGHEVDPDDMQLIYHDNSANALSLKTYDYSEDTWSEAAIGTMGGAASFLLMDAQVRLSDGHIIVIFNNAYNVATADIECWDITNAGTITQKANILTDTAEAVQVSIFINQVNGDFYAFYIRGTDWTTLTKAYYKKSEDGGATWSGETAYQADAEDDMRLVGLGGMKAAWGGRVLAYIWNSDLYDITVSYDNSILIASGVEVVEGSAAGSGIGLATSTSKLDVIAQALGNGIGLSQVASHLIISATASGQGIGLATAQAILDVLAAAAASGEGLGVCDWAWLRKKLRLVPYAYSPRREGGGST